MDKLTILYAGVFREGVKTRPLAGFTDYFFLEQTGRFHIAFFNFEDFIRGEDLRVEPQRIQPAAQLVTPPAERRGPVSARSHRMTSILWRELLSLRKGELASHEKPLKKDNPAILRCPYLGKADYDRLSRELLRFGYRLVILNFESHWYGSVRHAKSLHTDSYLIESRFPGCSFGSDGHGSIQPSIFIVRDEDSAAKSKNPVDCLCVGYTNSAESKAFADEFAEQRGSELVGEVFFEKYVPHAVFEGYPVAWRVFFFDGIAFYMAPLECSEGQVPDMPKPPEEAIGAFAKEAPSLFGSCDLVLEEAGGWKCSRFVDGQFTELPYGADCTEFASAFVNVAAGTPHLPEWSWCLTAYVKDENELGEDHRVVHGTRYFAPGTKLWLHPPNYDERVGAIGIPRFSDKLTRVVLDVNKLEGFGIEKTYDKEILTALSYSSSRKWPFSRFSPMGVGRGGWTASEESRSKILNYINWLNSLGAKTDD